MTMEIAVHQAETAGRAHADAYRAGRLICPRVPSLPRCVVVGDELSEAGAAR